MSTPTSFVPADQVISLFHSLMENADHIDRAFVHEWIYEGIKQIGPNLSWYDEAVVYPVELTLRKPSNLHYVIDLAIYDSAGSELRFVYRGKGSRIHASDNQLLNDEQYAPEQGAPIDISEDQYYFHIGSNGGEVAYAVVKYWKLPTDEEDNLLVPENDTFALALFCRYCYYMRKDDKAGMGFAKAEWIKARNEARSAHNTPHMLEGSEIFRSWNTMIKKMRFRTF